MSERAGGAPPWQLIDGIRCYAPDVALDDTDYPSQGFDVTSLVEARSFWCRSRIRVLRSVIRRFTDRTRQLDLLDIGCGTGSVAGGLRSLDWLRLTGSEIYLHGLRYAAARVPGVDFIQLDATRMPFQDTFDIVGAFDVLEHIDRDQLVIDNVWGALRDGGLFIVTVPQYQWMWGPLDEIVRHKRRYARRELAAKVMAGGFTIVYATSFVTTLFPLMALSRFAARFKPPVTDARAVFEAEVNLPAPLNWLFDRVMRIDETIIRLGGSLPFGGSLLMVARKSRT